MCKHYCKRRLQGGEFQCESSLLFSLIGLAMLGLHFAACWQVIQRSFYWPPDPSCDFLSVNSKGEWSELENTPLIDARRAKWCMFHYFSVPSFALDLWPFWIGQSVVAPIAFELSTILLPVARYSWPLRSWVMGVGVNHSVGATLLLESCLAPFTCTLEWP